MNQPVLCTQLGFGRYGTKSRRADRLSYQATEAACRAIIGHFHHIWGKSSRDLPISGKPTEVRTGRGKENPMSWVACVSTGQILFEMDGMSLSNAQQAATLAVHIPSSSTKIV
ncbi:hypothetical protein M9H77_07432 [Catharanthus roseus]|uniref:Uncharacterized protein n=1 Tax=Catharanthus roseus TaxID=4058 RepID=A0ACC0BV61_CATRO|nr:hypothetical protein M9H77_07432 [Catharanthus roseus]